MCKLGLHPSIHTSNFPHFLHHHDNHNLSRICSPSALRSKVTRPFIDKIITIQPALTFSQCKIGKKLRIDYFSLTNWRQEDNEIIICRRFHDMIKAKCHERNKSMCEINWHVFCTANNRVAKLPGSDTLLRILTTMRTFCQIVIIMSRKFKYVWETLPENCQKKIGISYPLLSTYYLMRL